jgi:DNA-binding transcriptional LysR family regulator
VSAPDSGRLRVQKIADYGLGLYASKQYLADHGPITQIADLKHLRGVGYVSDLIFDKELDYIPLVDATFRPHLTSTSIHVQLHAVRNGAGVGILHHFMAAEHDDLVRILPDDIALTRTFWYLVHEDYAQLERIRSCAKVLCDGIRDALQHETANAS